MEILTTTLNIFGEIRKLDLMETAEFPYKKRYYVSSLTSRLKVELEREFITRKLGDKVVVTRIK